MKGLSITPFSLYYDTKGDVKIEYNKAIRIETKSTSNLIFASENFEIEMHEKSRMPIRIKQKDKEMDLEIKTEVMRYKGGKSTSESGAYIFAPG